MNGPDVDRLLDPREAATFLNVPVSWIYQHSRTRAQDKLPYFKLGKYLRFSARNLSKWLETRQLGDING